MTQEFKGGSVAWVFIALVAILIGAIALSKCVAPIEEARESQVTDAPRGQIRDSRRVEPALASDRQ